MNMFDQQRCIKLTIEPLTKRFKVKTFIMLQKISFSNKCCSFELSIYPRILRGRKGITVFTKILSSTTVFIDNNKKWLLKIQLWR